MCYEVRFLTTAHMFIQIQETPNPNTLKFLPESAVLRPHFTASFSNIEECINAPLAKYLLEIKGTKSVFLASEFISVTKENEVSWDSLKTLIIAAIMDYYMAGYPVVLESFYTPQENTKYEVSNAIVNHIREIIDNKVRPAVAEDGGDILFHKFENGIVYLEMYGACSGCPSSTVTLKSGIEKMLKHYVPEVLGVVSI
ncbi:MAG: NifU family protein [Candidatus Midichloria sp.]|uniref:NFU1 iron-sulfur cluster scaffold homolog, mitochondrial n=1 Tax=Hyalomma marginatum TaxID=34627 RepID=A0A8S4C285_9ACAR|nr:NifU family protein [Hyalomma marginatum]CAG7592740.1 NifU family protein [Hyalomma marginatum]